MLPFVPPAGPRRPIPASIELPRRPCQEYHTRPSVEGTPINGQVRYAKADLLRDKGRQIMRYRSPVPDDLRKRCARMPQQCQLQRYAQSVPSLPPYAEMSRSKGSNV